ncbi:MAG: hypothetical protein ACE5LV_05255, partial [Candidatus Aminicenantales bacterium]
EDGDIEYTKKDLIRYYEDFTSGPLGIFLKKGRAGKYFYAKSFAYPLFAAPFVRVFGPNGPLVFHAVLLLLLMWMGFAYLARSNPPSLSAAAVLTFLFASVAGVYIFWISPDFFNLFLCFTILFLWLYKHRREPKEAAAEPAGRWSSFLRSDGSDFLAAFLIGIAVFSKPPNIVLLGLLVFEALLRKRFLKMVLIVLFFSVSSALFWGANHLVTGEWNYQGGERKSFYFTYPLEKSGITFDSIRTAEMTSDDYTKKHLLPAKFIPYNFFYYFFGRFTGIAWYFFPAFLILIVFFVEKKRLLRWLVFGAILAEILIYISLMPDNYAGGGGALANRYFLNIYPLFFFLSPPKRALKDLLLCWVAAAVFLAPILASPLYHSHYPGTHAKKLPFKLLPVEMTLVNNFPTNTNPNAFRQEVGVPPHIGWLHFLDDNFHPRLRESETEKHGFWTRGPRTAEMVLKTYYPVKRLEFHLLNNPRMRNGVVVQVGNRKQKVLLGTKQRATLAFEDPKPFKIKALHLYRIKIRASKGAIPYYETEESRERRFLGVFFEITIIPEE